MSAKTVPEVLLYYPNLIGYLRVSFMFLSFYFATSTESKNWKYSMGAYLAAFIGDVVDGHVARSFNQCSKFGGVLDMITDRVSTCGLLMVLCVMYPTNAFNYIFLAVLDIASHWFHVMSVTAHHKSKEALEDRNALLQWYYSVYPLFAYCCVGCELFYVAMYILGSNPGATPLFDVIPKANFEIFCWYICFPGCFIKQLVNCVQLWSACWNIAKTDIFVDAPAAPAEAPAAAAPSSPSPASAASPAAKRGPKSATKRPRSATPSKKKKN